MSKTSIPYILLSGFLFGTTLVASRFSVGQFNPTTYVSLRLILSSIGYLMVYLFRIGGRRWPGDLRLWRRSSVFGILGTAIPMTLIVNSLQFQSSGVTSLLITANPALTVLFAHYYLDDERLTTKKFLGVFLALAGAVFLVTRGESGLPDLQQANPIGYGMVFIAMISGSIATIYARKSLSEWDSFDVASIRNYVATVIVFPISLGLFGFDLGRVQNTGLMALIYASIIGTFLGFLIQFYNIQRFGATAAVMAGYIIPLVASAGGALFLGEVITFGMLGGMGLIISGIYLIQTG